MKKFSKSVVFLIAVIMSVTMILPWSVLAANSEVSHKKGDVNRNGIVNSSDALLVQRYIIGLEKFDSQQLELADVNNDSKVTSRDVLLIIRSVVGLGSFDDLLAEEDNSSKAAETDNKETQSNNFSAEAQEVLRLVNIERKAEGLQPLELDVTLCKLSNIRVKEIQREFSHLRPDGRAWSTVFSDNGIDYRAAGENLAAGYTTAEAAVHGWMMSPGHRANIMNPSFNKMGLTLYFVDDDMYGYYWEQLFSN